MQSSRHLTSHVIISASKNEQRKKGNAIIPACKETKKEKSMNKHVNHAIKAMYSNTTESATGTLSHNAHGYRSMRCTLVFDNLCIRTTCCSCNTNSRKLRVLGKVARAMTFPTDRTLKLWVCAGRLSIRSTVCDEHPLTHRGTHSALAMRPHTH